MSDWTMIEVPSVVVAGATAAVVGVAVGFAVSSAAAAFPRPSWWSSFVVVRSFDLRYQYR